MKELFWDTMYIQFGINISVPPREAELAELFDEDGFAHMGDLGFYDENGVLFFKSVIYTIQGTFKVL